MKQPELTKDELEFILLMSATPTTEEGKRLVNEAEEKYFDKIDWSRLCDTPIAGDDSQKKSVEKLIGSCEFTS